MSKERVSNDLQKEPSPRWYSKAAVQAAIAGSLITGGVTIVSTLMKQAPEPAPIVPIEPSRVRINFSKKSGVIISWQDNSDNEKGFKIYRQFADTARSWRLVDIVPANTTRFEEEIRFLRMGYTYQYAVSSYNDAGESERIPISITKK